MSRRPQKNAQPIKTVGFAATRRPGLFIAGDPRLLILAFFAIIVFSFLIDDTRGLLVAFIYVVFLYHAVGASSKSIARNTRTVIPFVALIVIVNAILIEGEPIASFAPFISHEGMMSGIHYGVRLLVLYLAMMVFLMAASPESIATGVAAILKPISKKLARRVALYGFLSIGFLPLFADEIRRIRIAQRFRGGGFDGGPLRRLSSVRLLLVPLFLSAIQRSGQLAMAVELRQIKQTIVPLLDLGSAAPRDYLFACTTIAIMIFAWRVL